MSYRKEKKYRLTINEFFLMKKTLLDKGMVALYDTRKVNSVYFDNFSHDMFSQSEEGVLPRKKIRLRWYENNNDFTLEKKISSIEGRFKIVNKSKNYKNMNEVINATLFEKEYGTLYPSLLVSYDRTYYTLNKMRITFDFNINYKNLRLNSLINYIDPERVVEIKTPIDCGDDFIKKSIPYPTSRFSKYSRGLLISQRNLAEF
tara:strand:+ start:1559 stop:2167 length:609 start_codon:yes stop_codon:yes gene_type:complete